MQLSEGDKVLRGVAYEWIREVLKSNALHDYLVEQFDNGKQYEGLQMKLKVALSFLQQKLYDTIRKGQEDAAETV